MNISKAICIWLVCTFTVIPSFAQLSDEENGIVSANQYTRYFNLGFGGVRQYFRDEALSKLDYTGYGVAPSFGHVKYNHLTWSELSMQGSVLTAKRKDNGLTESEMKVTRAYFDYKFLVGLKIQNERYDVRIGGTLSGVFCHKHAPQFQNAGDVYEYAIGLGVGAMGSRTQEMWGKSCKLTWSLSTPVLSRFARPVILNQVKRLKPEEDNHFNDYFGTGTSAFLGKYVGIKSRVGFIYPLSNGNAMNFAYQWDYYQMKDVNNAVYFAEHTVSLTYMFNY
jgi:hypothetical protein